MANVLNRTTKQFLQSVNTPDHPVGQWIINPDMSAVIGFDSRYWIITGDVVTLMDSVARAAVDSANLATSRDQTANQLDGVDNIQRAFMLIVLDEFNSHALKINSILDAVDAATTLADFKTRVLAIVDYPARTAAQLKAALRGKLGG